MHYCVQKAPWTIFKAMILVKFLTGGNTNSTSGRERMSVGGPAMVALKHGGRRSARITQGLTRNGPGRGKGRS